MPRYLVQVQGKYAVWSSIVDAPVSWFHDTLQGLQQEIDEQFSIHAQENVLKYPTMTEENAVAWNRAGAQETTLNAAQLLHKFHPDRYEQYVKRGEG